VYALAQSLQQASYFFKVLFHQTSFWRFYSVRAMPPAVDQNETMLFLGYCEDGRPMTISYPPANVQPGDPRFLIPLPPSDFSRTGLVPDLSVEDDVQLETSSSEQSGASARMFGTPLGLQMGGLTIMVVPTRRTSERWVMSCGPSCKETSL
jgi:hypothetical protein